MDENLANDEKAAFESSVGDSSGPSFYSGSGKTLVSNKAKFRGFLKKGGPMLLITGLIGGFGALMMGAQTLMPIAIGEMIIEKFNSVGVSSTLASDAWLDTQLNQGMQSSGTNNKYGISSYQVQSFEGQGMKVVNAGGVTAILYLKNGTYIPVVGSSFVNNSGLAESIKTASGLSNVGTPVTAAVALADPDFKIPYTTAAKGWRGGASGWFDKIMTNITEAKLSVNRNRWSRFVASGVSDITEEFNKIAASSIRTKTSDFSADETIRISVDQYNKGGWDEGNEYIYNTKIIDGGGGNTSVNGEKLIITNVTPVYKKDGKGNDVLVGYDVSGNNNASSTNGVTESSLTEVLNSKAVKAATMATDMTCAGVEGLMSIYTVVSAYQSLQFLNLVSGYLEAVDKVKAGDGNDSPIHTYASNLTTKADTVSAKSDGTATENSMGGVKEEVVANKTAMESQGIAWLFDANSKINPSNPSVQNTNLEAIMSNISSITSNVSLTAQTFEACGYAKVATSAIKLMTTTLSLIPIIGGEIKLMTMTAGTVATALIKGAAMVFFYAAIPVIAKKVANSIIKDAATEWFGEDLGNALVSGAGKYLGGNGTSGGQGPGSENKVLSYLQERDTVIADEAEYQRAIRSPFDASSKYTFLGSMAYSIIPLAYSSSGIMSTLRNVSSLASSSIIAMTPTANAISEESAMNSVGECAMLESTGAVGDAFCNAYIITDTSTISTSPIAVAEIVNRLGETEIATQNNYVGVSSNNFNSDGSIKKDSNLAKYITYCGQRTSQYGVRDAKIAASLSNGNISGFISMVPVIGDMGSVISAISDVTNFKWTTGRACVASEDNDMWEENKWYQRYAENERLLENINPDYKSTVTAYIEDYYEENPLDNSLEGQIARFSGMSKEDVEDTIALMQYYVFLANYNPSERYAFTELRLERKNAVSFDDKNSESFYNIWWYNNIYDRVGEVKARAKKAEYEIC